MERLENPSLQEAEDYAAVPTKRARSSAMRMIRDADGSQEDR